MEVSWDYHCAEHAVQALGRDIWKELGGCPRSAKEAAALYRRLGVRTLRQAATKVLGKPVNPKRAMRGDIVMVRTDRFEALGICRGDLIECADRMVPIAQATTAWRVKSKP